MKLNIIKRTTKKKKKYINNNDNVNVIYNKNACRIAAKYWNSVTRLSDYGHYNIQ